ncbi:MAG TPA: tetratricopeptide repeat protein [Terracidiphilus sp.]|nr:tetratricopeptide repeat protein [Terracidiphilus sp.]
MKTTHSMRNHEHCVNQGLPFKRVLIAILIASLATLVTELFAQGSSSRLLARDLSSQNTVSANQLLTPGKALQAAQRARNQLIAGRIDQAQKEITHALDISPRCALALNIQGAIHLETQHFENAVEDFQEAIQADSELGSAYLGLGMSLIAQNRLKEAQEPLDRAAHLLPGSWLIYFEAALTHLGLGDAEAALKQINYAERFTETNPERRSGTVYMRGMVYINLRDFDRARQYLEDSVALDPNGFYAALALTRLKHLRPLPTNAK